jgi:hypothetical protein
MTNIAKADAGHIVPVQDSTSLISAIARAAENPAVDIEKMERLFAMHEKMQATQARTEYMAALAQLQADIPDNIPENGKIEVHGNVKSRYALWEDVNKAIRPVMQRHGFAISFRTTQEAQSITVSCVLSHSGGHDETTSLTLPHDGSGSKNAVQAVGSSITYGKRYTAGELLNLTSRGMDDDGKKAGDPGINEQQYLAISDMVERTGTDLTRLLATANIDRLDDLPSKSFGLVMASLKQKLAIKVSAAAAAAAKDDPEVAK